MALSTKLSFKDALNQIATIVAKLEGDECELEEMANLYEKGVVLLQFCEAKISDTKMRIEKINSGEFFNKTDEDVFFDNKEE